jgi:UDP-glucuronate 4-epimerase
MGQFLVTGAAGFIAARVCQQLLDEGHAVLGLDNMNDAYDIRLKEWRLDRLRERGSFSFLEADITDAARLKDAQDVRGYDGVINLAARAGVRQSVKDPGVYFQTNVLGTLNLLDFARDQKIPKFVQASTSSLYGAHNETPFAETADVSRPLSPYAASKGGAEALCHSYHHLYNMDITILRYFTVYGPAGRPDMSIFRFIQWILEEKTLRVYGDGLQERDFTFVGDIARGTVSALRPLGFEVINLGGDRPESILNLIHIIEEKTGMKAVIEHHDEAPADVRATWADIDKAMELLQWRPRVDLDEGIEASIEWYLAERDWAKTVSTSD